MKRCLAFFLSLFLTFSLAVSSLGASSIFSTKAQDDFTQTQQTTSAKPNLTKIQDLSAYKTTDSSITIHWKKVDGAEYYAVYMFSKKTASFELYSVEAENNCTVSSLSAGSTYRFKVTACADYENETITGKSSDELIAVTACEKIKSIVTKDISKSSITLSWTSSGGATSYEVWLYNKNKGKFVLYDIVQTEQASITGLDENTLYNFKIRAVREDSNAVSYSKFSEIYTEFTDTSTLPYTKAQAAKLYNTTINSAKQSGSMTVSYTKSISTNAVSCSKPSLLRTVKNILNLFNGEISEKHKFTSGKDSETTIKKLLEPYSKSASIRGCDILKFSVKKQDGQTVLKIILKTGSASYDGTTTSTASVVGRAFVPPVLENLLTSPIKVKSAEEKFKNTTLNMVISENSSLKSLSIVSNAEIEASCRVSTVSFTTVVGYELKETYKIS